MKWKAARSKGPGKHPSELFSTKKREAAKVIISLNDCFLWLRLYIRLRISASECKLCLFVILSSFEAKQLSKLIHQNQFNVSSHGRERWRRGMDAIEYCNKERCSIDKLLFLTACCFLAKSSGDSGFSFSSEWI